MGDDTDVVLYTLLPLLGTILSIALGLSPYQTLRECDKNSDLGDFNPLPPCVFFLTNVAWVGYGVLVKNVFVLVTNGVLLPINLQLTFWGYRLASRAYRGHMEWLIHGYTFVLLLSSFLFIYNDKYDENVEIMGYVAMCFNSSIFVPPLFLMKTVISTKNASPIFAPFAMVGVVNSIFWVVYAILINSVPILVPNLIGAALTMVQLMLVLLYPAPSNISAQDTAKVPLIG